MIGNIPTSINPMKAYPPLFKFRFIPEQVFHLTAPPKGGSTALWGSGPKDLWTVGYRKVHHYDGTGWSTKSLSSIGSR